MDFMLGNIPIRNARNIEWACPFSNRRKLDFMRRTIWI